MGFYYLYSNICLTRNYRNTNLLFTIMKTTYKASQRDVNMPVDKEWQKRFIKYLCWGLPQFTFWMIMLTHFLFYVIRGN